MNYTFTEEKRKRIGAVYKAKEVEIEEDDDKGEDDDQMAIFITQFKKFLKSDN